jgi:mannitol/fructose-specific phosphotransferase system IIA component (Ntr-type)
LLFLLCCQDDRIHLHTLSRICMMALKTEMLSQLRAAPDATAMRECIIAAEQEVLAAGKPSA